MNIRRLTQWLNELPYNKQLGLGRKSLSQDKTVSLMGLQLLKLGMRGAGFSGFSLQDLAIGANGKPKGSGGADFSISHAGGLIACAIGVGARVGIDVEPVSASPVTRRLRRYLSGEELAIARRDDFQGLRIWTAKEAVIKAVGDAGLADLPAVRVRGERGFFRDCVWYLHEPRVAAGHLVRLATDQADPLISVVDTPLP